MNQPIFKRLVAAFETDESGHRPVNDYYTIYKQDEHFKDLILFYEYFHGDTARGVGASHQTGWTAELINSICVFETNSSREENINKKSSKAESMTA